jgi:hypothetical protein
VGSGRFSGIGLEDSDDFSGFSNGPELGLSDGLSNDIAGGLDVV